MRITKEQLDQRINSPDNLVNLVVRTPTRDRGANLSETTRDRISDLVTSGEMSQAEVAEQFEISQATVSQAVTGHIGGRPPNDARREKIRARRIEAKDVALAKLMKTLGLISEDKMEDMDPKALSTTALNLARVAREMEDSRDANSAQINIIVYSPESKEEGRYKVVEV